MLNSTTKARIDALRNMLVGKEPVPSRQVELITLGLMYKFMADLDEEYARLGSKPFFSKDYESYAWPKIMAQTDARERARLYAEGLEKMSLNPGIPQLFRDIFKGAFLSFRDPAIINQFLKGIDEFRYEHSEDLGDAFEYLLMIMGAQGDAGQFRTPRHIIDFIVECVDPQKTDRILDPACGTAGFLISAYKHILKQNTLPNDPRPGSALTTSERRRLVQNFTGYDISHDMVRMALVNLYLHLFPDPRIYEYDTLSSEERWREDADCILANPPFMSPKGGIRPHNRFQIKAKRSEVLFVDYMLEHLTPQGKMGVIVPEGIIFQSATAYKALRKMLVDQDYLWAVVSLPGGVFNPYSGVKTSILLVDRALARKTDDILFVKVENDGFDLGAQRKEVEGSELPRALKAIRAYRKAITEGKDPRDVLQRLSPNVPLGEVKHVNFVRKTEIAEGGDFALTGERYRTTIRPESAEWPFVRLGNVTQVISGQSPDGRHYNERGDGLPFYQGKADFGETYLKPPRVWTTQITKEALKNDILMSVRAPVGPVNLAPSRICIGRGLASIRPGEQLSCLYLFYVLRIAEERIRRCSSGSTFEAIGHKQIEDFAIPLPPLSVQQEIVAELDGYQKVADGARQVVENYKTAIAIDPRWKARPLSELIKLSSGKFLPQRDFREGPYLVYGGNGSSGRHDRYFLEESTLIIGRVGEYCGAVHLTQPKSWVTDNALCVTEHSADIVLEYLCPLLNQLNLNQYAKVGGQPSISQGTVFGLSIPVPSLEIQKKIVARIEEEQQLVQANRRLIELFEAKIRDRIKEVWGDQDAGKQQL